MKVIKDQEHCLLLNYFGLNKKFYVAVTVMTYFDLKDPDNPLKEQDMWPFVQGELGKDAILDMAMPKPKGEVLVWGRCFAPDGEPRIASRVSLQIAGIEKTLDIFGNRFWKKTVVGFNISEPRPFKEMPLTYERAFGGQGYDKNPAGRGISSVRTPAGKEDHPLPNIEDPKQPIGSPSDRPDPAGFAPIYYTWPQRAKKLGTYANTWFQEHWPFYPDDMDWTYFNAAPEDQQRDDFLQMHEPFLVAGMHPKRPVIESRLPGIRHRIFINQLADAREPEGESLFKEVIAHIDTLWLFPHAEKGVAIWRGTAEVKDDEAIDVPHLYIVSESPGQMAETIERYHEQFLKRIDRAVPVDIAPQMEKAKEKLSGLADMLRDLPLQINDRIAQNLGKAPMAKRTPAEVAARVTAVIDEQTKLFVESEKRINSLKADFGHLMKIDTGGFAYGIKALQDAKAQIAKMPGLVEDVKQMKTGGLKTLNDVVKEQLAGINAEAFKARGIDFDELLADRKEEPGNPWHESGMRFLDDCRENLKNDPELMSAFRSLGFRPYTLKRNWIGVTRAESRFDRTLWGLDVPGDGPETDTLIIPAGLVIPRFTGAALDHITVRPLPFDKGAITPAALLGTIMDQKKDNFVEGSKETALALGVEEEKAVVRVENEMEAILLRQELGDACGFIAMRDPSIKPAKDTGSAIEKAPQFIAVFPPGSPSGPDSRIEAAGWNTVHPSAEPLALPQGANVIDAKRSGADIWQWVVDALRPGTAPGPESKPKEIDVMEPGAVASLIPTIDVAALVKKVRAQLMGTIQPGMDLINAKEKEAMKLFRTEFAKKGLNIDELMAKNPPPVLPEGANPYLEAKKTYAQASQQIRQKLTAQPAVFTPAMQKEFDEIGKKTQEVLSASAKRFEDGIKQLEDGKKKLEAGSPDWAKKLMAKAGLDPEDPEPLKALSREDVIDRHARGLSLAGKNLAGADLSDLDLTGADLRRANLQKANLSCAVLDNGDLTKAIATEADFKKTSLKGAILVKGIFQKAKFPDADLAQADLSRAMMSEADLTGADLSGATLIKTLFEKSKLKKVRAVNARASQIYLLSADISGADFSGADLTKGVFLKTNIDGVNFSRSTLQEASFLESKGKKVNFSRANMHNSRILLGSAMPGSNFTDTTADRASWMKSDLSGSDFRGSTIERGLLEGCDLSGSNLSGVKAKQARLTKSNISDSNLKGINLFQGSLRKSKLVRTDLSEANLYGAEFYRTGVGETVLDDANLKMTKLYKREDLLPEPPDKKKK